MKKNTRPTSMMNESDEEEEEEEGIESKSKRYLRCTSNIIFSECKHSFHFYCIFQIYNSTSSIGGGSMDDGNEFNIPILKKLRILNLISKLEMIDPNSTNRINDDKQTEIEIKLNKILKKIKIYNQLNILFLEECPICLSNLNSIQINLLKNNCSSLSSKIILKKDIHLISKEEEIKDISFNNLKDYFKKYTNLILFFYLPNCNFCEEELKLLIQIKKEFSKSDLNFLKINCEKEIKLKNEYKINSFPSILLFKFIENEIEIKIFNQNDVVVYTEDDDIGIDSSIKYFNLLKFIKKYIH